MSAMDSTEVFKLLSDIRYLIENEQLYYLNYTLLMPASVHLTAFSSNPANAFRRPFAVVDQIPEQLIPSFGFLAGQPRIAGSTSFRGAVRVSEGLSPNCSLLASFLDRENFPWGAPVDNY